MLLFLLAPTSHSLSPPDITTTQIDQNSHTTEDTSALPLQPPTASQTIHIRAITARPQAAQLNPELFKLLLPAAPANTSGGPGAMLFAIIDRLRKEEQHRKPPTPAQSRPFLRPFIFLLVLATLAITLAYVVSTSVTDDDIDTDELVPLKPPPRAGRCDDLEKMGFAKLAA